MTELYKRTIYLTDIPLIINGSIFEYDISKANINMLYAYELIDKSDYDRLYCLDKMSREIAIGRRMRDENDKMLEDGNKMALCIKNGITEAKRLLFESNKISDDSIIRIANDAVYINGGILPYTSFDINHNGRYITFATKSFYNIMINLNKVSIFINDNSMKDSYSVDVKGINDNLLPYHEAFLSFICDLITGLSRSGKETTLYKFNDFYKEYINGKLPIEFYREFNATSGYKIKDSNYTVEFIDKTYFDKVDISYNLNVLRNLYSIILTS